MSQVIHAILFHLKSVKKKKDNLASQHDSQKNIVVHTLIIESMVKKIINVKEFLMPS